MPPLLRRVSFTAGIIVTALPLSAVASEPPVLVAPGEPSAFAAAGPCPTFHWGVESAASGYELTVFRLPERRAGSGQAPPQPEPVLREALPGSARGWTPSVDRCLAAGRYGWAMRAGGRGAAGAGAWSEPRYFEVAPVPTPEQVALALEVLQRYVAAGGALAAGSGGPGGDASAAPVRPSARQASPAPPPRRIAGDLLAIPDATGLRANLGNTTGAVFGVHGVSRSTGDGSAGVVGQSTAASGDVAGVHGQVVSAAGSAGVFDNLVGGDVLRGLAGGTEVFRVEGDGDVVATSFTGDGSGLTNLPAGSADDVACDGCVGTGDLDDASVTGPKLSFDPATQAELDVHATSADHDSRYVEAAGDTLTGGLDLGGHALSEVSLLSRSGAANDLTLSSGRHIVLDAPAGDIVLNAPDATIHLEAPVEVAGALSVGVEDAAGGAVSEVATLSHTAAGAAASGIGAALGFAAEDAAGQLEGVARIEAVLGDAADGAETGLLRFLTRAGGAGLAEAASLDGAGNLAANSFTGDGAGLSGVVADSAAALAADGADCSPGQAAAGVDAAGASEGCFDVATEAELAAHQLSADHDDRYARLAAANQFVADQTITGNLTLSGSINSGFRVETNGTSPNVIGGYGGPFSPNSVLTGVWAATIAGGGSAATGNRVYDGFGAIGGGAGNQAGLDNGLVNDMQFATVAGGNSNTASSSGAAVGGGFENVASGVGTVVGGGFQNAASGIEATIPGGRQNAAGGFTSFAAGRRAKANHDGSFVWGDSTDADVASGAAGQFVARASGGVVLYTDGGLTTGVKLAAGGSEWTDLAGVPIGGGDVTAVHPGTGLAGGGTDGELTLSVDAGGIGTTELAGDAVTSLKILDGEVSTADLAFDPATQGELDAHRVSGDHDAAYVDSGGDAMGGPLDMAGQVLSNVGAAGTDFSSSGGLTLADDLALENGETISNSTDHVLRFSDGTDVFDIVLGGSAALKTGGYQQQLRLELGPLGPATGTQENGEDIVLVGGRGQFTWGGDVPGGSLTVGGANLNTGDCPTDAGGNCGGHLIVAGGGGATSGFSGGGNVILRGGAGTGGWGNGHVLVLDSDLGIGVSDPSERLEVAGNAKVSGYLQLGLTSGAPAGGDCDAAGEEGRSKLDPATGTLYLCGTAGWVAK